MVLNSLNFCLSEKLFISPSILNEILAWYSNVSCRFFPFSTSYRSCHSLLACRVSPERSAVKCMGFPLCVTCYSSLAASNILSLCLVFVSLISMCLGMFLLGFILYGTLCDPMDCSRPGSFVQGILQARVLEWVAISFSGDLPDPGIEPRSPTSQEDALPSEPPGKPQHILKGLI